jgi:hypothetical protein
MGKTPSRVTGWNYRSVRCWKHARRSVPCDAAQKIRAVANIGPVAVITRAAVKKTIPDGVALQALKDLVRAGLLEWQSRPRCKNGFFDIFRSLAISAFRLRRGRDRGAQRRTFEALTQANQLPLEGMRTVVRRQTDHANAFKEASARSPHSARSSIARRPIERGHVDGAIAMFIQATSRHRGSIASETKYSEGLTACSTLARPI